MKPAQHHPLAIGFLSPMAGLHTLPETEYINRESLHVR